MLAVDECPSAKECLSVEECASDDDRLDVECSPAEERLDVERTDAECAPAEAEERLDVERTDSDCLPADVSFDDHLLNHDPEAEFPLDGELPLPGWPERLEDDPDDARPLDEERPEGEPVKDEPLVEALDEDSREGDPGEVFPCEDELREDELPDEGSPEGEGPGEGFFVRAEDKGCPMTGAGDGADADDWLSSGASDGVGPDCTSRTRTTTGGDGWSCSLRRPRDPAPGGSLESKRLSWG